MGFYFLILSSKWDSTFSFVKEQGFSFFFLSRVGKISFLIVKDLRNLLFSVSRLWKISLFDCQVLWVQYNSTFSFVKEQGFSFFFLSRVGKISFLIVKDLRNLLFSVSRLWKISLFDCQVLWVQYNILLLPYFTSIL